MLNVDVRASGLVLNFGFSLSKRESLVSSVRGPPTARAAKNPCKAS